MKRADRKLVKQPVDQEVSHVQPHPPPLEDGPDLGETLRLLERISRMPDIRFEKVQQMRELIARGEFETPERLEGTVKRLLEELGL